MILRILTEGQLEVDDSHVDELNILDDRLTAAVESGEKTEFRMALEALLAAVRSYGTPVPDDVLVDSDLILPPGDASLEEVQEMLTEEGLIPGTSASG